MPVSLRTAAALLAMVIGLTACGDDDVTSTSASTSPPAPSTTIADSTTSTEAASSTTTVPPSSSTTTTAPPSTTEAADAVTTIEVTVRGGTIEGGGRHEVVLGSQVRLIVDADVSDEIHVHGYDLSADVAPDVPAVLEMTADIPGIFEVELESAHLGILELEVTP